MKLAILIASRNRPDLVDPQVRRLRATVRVPCDVYVVECGSELGRVSEHATLWYPDPEFKGKCFGHALLLDQARKHADYDYVWVLMNDVVFDGGGDPAAALIDVMQREPRLAILSPTSEDGAYPGSDRRPGGEFRKVATVDYLGFMMRTAAIDDAGFLNPAFKWCWGAIHELAYRLYERGWFVAYSDDVTYRHLGGTTYGALGTNTVSREEYQRNARRFAWAYFRETYGADWPARFFAATAGHAIETDTFALHERLWRAGFDEAEIAARWPSDATADAGPRDDALACPSGADLVRVHLGCGGEYRDGWLNVDAHPDVRADLHASASALPQLADASVDVIEANHLFEHLPLHEALAALREWRRILRPGGRLFLELPDLDACVRLLGRHRDEQGLDLALVGLFGFPPLVEQQGLTQVHKWGWTRAALLDALLDAGFEHARFGPITQTWRPAAKIGRDMRVAATVPAPAVDRTDDALPLATGAAVRLFAWPDYADARDLDVLFGTFARAFSGRTDVALCLRHDRLLDGPAEVVTEALEAAGACALGPHASLEVLLVDDDLGPADWGRLGRALEGAIVLPSSRRAPRSVALAALFVGGVPRLADASELARVLAGIPTAARRPALSA